MNKRDFEISKKQNELWTCKVTDSYGNVSVNYFETTEECMRQVYYIWEREDDFKNQDSMQLLNNAIEECVELDEESGVEPSLD